jgi:hypothetical protein
MSYVGEFNKKLYSFCGENDFGVTYDKSANGYTAIACGYAVKWGNCYPYAVKINNFKKLSKFITTKKYKHFFEVEMRKIAKTNMREFSAILKSGYILFPTIYEYDNVIKNKNFKTYKDLYKIRKQMILK